MKRRDTYEYFGDPIYTYSLKQAIEDGFLVPYLLEQRVTNVDENGYVGPDGKLYRTENFERDIRLPDRTRLIAEDLWQTLSRLELHNEKTLIFCVDDTHAAFLAQELRRVSGDPDYAARITRAERNSHQLERNFGEVGRAKPRVAVTVDLLTTGFDAPDVRNIVFVRPLRSAILYKQMKGRGTRLCEDIDKRYFTIFDYSRASSLEDAEFDGHPANVQKPARGKPSSQGSAGAGGGAGGGPGGGGAGGGGRQKPVGNGVSVFISKTERYICLADGQKIPLDQYRERSKEVIRSISPASLDELLKLWIDRKTRGEVRAELKDRDIHVAAFRHFLELEDADDVDILGKVGLAAGLLTIAFSPATVARRLGAFSVWLVVLVVCARHPVVAGAVLAHAHNLLALGIWLVWAAHSRSASTPVLLAFGGAAAALLAGAAEPVWAAVGAFTSPTLGADLPIFGRTLAPWASAAACPRWVALFAFAQSVHYAIWLRVIPDERRARPGVRSFASSYRALVADLGTLTVFGFAGASVALVAFACLDLAAAKGTYFRLAAFHGYLELALALGWLTAKYPTPTRMS